MHIDNYILPGGPEFPGCPGLPGLDLPGGPGGPFNLADNSAICSE